MVIAKCLLLFFSSLLFIGVGVSLEKEEKTAVTLGLFLAIVSLAVASYL